MQHHIAPIGEPTPEPIVLPTKVERRIRGLLNGIHKLIGYKLPSIDIEGNNTHISMNYEGKYLTTIVSSHTSLNLRKVVYQNVLRLIHNEPQQEGCPLMSPYDLPLTDRQADKLFVKLMKKHPEAGQWD